MRCGSSSWRWASGPAMRSSPRRTPSSRLPRRPGSSMRRWSSSIAIRERATSTRRRSRRRSLPERAPSCRCTCTDCADLKAISEIARKHKFFVVEDSAQAIDGHGDGWKQGELSDAVCTSFIIQKNLGTFGDGGAVVTNRDDVAAEIFRLRNHGSVQRSVHSMGYNSRLDDLHAAILGVKLRYITRWTDRRREIAARYTRGLQGTSLTLPFEPSGYRHVYHLYVVEHPKRDSLERFLLDNGVDAKLHYPIAIHQQEGYPWGK